MPRITSPAAPDPKTPRAPVLEEPPQPETISMLESWSMDEATQLGLGRFRIAEPPRPRSNMERVRSPMDRETRAIAGAGLSIRFH